MPLFLYFAGLVESVVVCVCVRKLDKDDIQLIIDGLEVVLENFEKRLDIYLKKYGLSKIKTWTYLVD